MNAANRISLRVRVLVFFLLWIIASSIWAISLEHPTEAGESDLGFRLLTVYLPPLEAANDITFVFLHRNLDVEHPDAESVAVVAVIVCLFILQ
jgi:hypothetical protein